MPVIWKLPPIIKVYEALGSIADNRIEMMGNEAKVYSSSRGKFYTVKYSPDTNSITSNDNATYYMGYLGYPAVAFLLKIGKLTYSHSLAEAFKDVKWKDLNVQFRNDFFKTQEYVLRAAEEKGFSKSELVSEAEIIFEQLKKLSPQKLGEKMLPPEGY
jgi:hypothetical protein